MERPIELKEDGAMLTLWIRQQAWQGLESFWLSYCSGVRIVLKLSPV